MLIFQTPEEMPLKHIAQQYNSTMLSGIQIVKKNNKGKQGKSFTWK
jgi:hypothetical protein